MNSVNQYQSAVLCGSVMPFSNTSLIKKKTIQSHRKENNNLYWKTFKLKKNYKKLKKAVKEKTIVFMVPYEFIKS